jgi:excisionase family DNA binding protein
VNEQLLTVAEAGESEPLSLYSQSEAAVYLGVHQTHVREMVTAGYLRPFGHTQRGWLLFRQEELDAVVKPKLGRPKRAIS